MSYSDRLNNVIPGGAHTYSRGNDQFPQNAPQILTRGEGAHVWDAFGNRFLDYGMGLRSVSIGYANSRINTAAFKQIEQGNNLTRPSLIELEAAELFSSIVPGADMVKFAKNGSSVTTAAVKLARAFTGAKYVCIPRQHPFFSFDDWFIGTTNVKRGTLSGAYDATLVFDYNDLASLKTLFEMYEGQIAAVLMEPITTETPCPPKCNMLETALRCNACPHNSENFLKQVQELCKRNNALLILDEMITGFRWSFPGAGTYFGVDADLMTFGKAIANGFSVAALAGKREIMNLGGINSPGQERTFLLSSTHGAEMAGLGALVETIRVYQEFDVCKGLWEFGKRLREGIQQICTAYGMSDYVQVTGFNALPSYIIRDSNLNASPGFRTLFMQEMIKNGVLMPWIAPSFAHGESELDQTLNAVDRSLPILGQALEKGLQDFLIGAAIKPVFRRFN